MYTSMILLSDDEDWVPDRLFLRDLAEYLCTDCFQIVTAYDHPLYWEHEEQHEELIVDGPTQIVRLLDDSLWRMNDISIDKALDQWTTQQVAVIHFCLPFCSWAKSMTVALEAHTSDILNDGYIAWDIHWMVGPWSICNHDELVTKARGRFYLSLSGDGCPADPDEYLRRFLTVKEIKDLTAWVRQRSGQTFKWIWSLS